MEAIIENKGASLEKAEQAKVEGNELFKQGKFQDALDAYTTACGFGGDSPKSAIYYSNRAFANIKLENYGLALEDAESAIKADPGYVKGYYRKGSAFVALSKYGDALKTFKKALSHCPADQDIATKVAEVKKMHFEQQFALSIQRDDEPPASSKLKPDDLVVPDSYDGPRLEKTDEITQEWVLKLLEYLRLEKRFHKKYLWLLLLRIKEILQKLSSLVDVKIPDDEEFTICGDVHGQYYDVLNIWKLNGYPSAKNPYLFNGDFVDRGSFSVEVIIALFAWKALDPSCVHLNRGNHESKNLNKIYGFEGEVKFKYCPDTMSLFSEVFCQLPLCHVLNNQVMIVHGGLFAKDGVMLDDIRKLDRNREIPDEGTMCDILWSDPVKVNGRHPSKRGVSMGFGPDVARKFLDDNKLKYLVRSHEVKDEGYEVEADGRVITIFSAPNYCDQMKNKGAFIRMKGNELKPNFTKFEAVPHPPVQAMKYAAGANYF